MQPPLGLSVCFEPNAALCFHIVVPILPTFMDLIVILLGSEVEKARVEISIERRVRDAKKFPPGLPAYEIRILWVDHRVAAIIDSVVATKQGSRCDFIIPLIE